LLGSGLEGGDESSTAYYAYIDGERYVLSKNPHPLLRMAGARKYQQVFGRYGFEHVMACEEVYLSEELPPRYLSIAIMY